MIIIEKHIITEAFDGLSKLAETKLIEKKIDVDFYDKRLAAGDRFLYCDPEEAFELSQYLDKKRIRYTSRTVKNPATGKFRREFTLDLSSPRSSAESNELIQLSSSYTSLLASIGVQTRAFDIDPEFEYRISRGDLFKLKSLVRSLDKVWKDDAQKERRSDILDKIKDIVDDLRPVTKSSRSHQSYSLTKPALRVSQIPESIDSIAEDFQECNLKKMGTNEYEANENRDKHIKMYRKFANLNDDELITEENINDWALQKTATTCNRHPDRIRSEILGRRYSAYEV